MRKLTTEEFIIKAKAVHGDNYDYSKTLYLDSVSKVEVNCHKHGAFYQLPHSHLRGSGCPSCANVKVVTTSEFISRARNVHGNLYDYSLSIVHGMKRRLKIICAIHGEFHQSPASHLSGSGCPSCSGNERKDTSNFIKKAIHLHGSKYDYSFVSYSWTHGKVIIICKKHGEFSQTAHNHLMGQGCPGCSQRGFSPHKEAFLYFLISSDGCNLKVGISNNIKRRINALCRSTPFEFNLIAKVKTTGAEAMRLEKYYHRKYESAGLTGFDGATEWLRYSPELMNEIMK